MSGLTILQIAAAAMFSLPFDNGQVPGVKGQAAFFDGFDSRVVVQADEVPVPQTHFTVDMWVCPISFPKSPCPLVCRQRNDVPGGWSLWLDVFGKVHFQVANAGEWIEIVAPESIQLRQWSRITAMFRGSKGLYLAIDGKQVAGLNTELPAVYQKDYDLWVGRTPVRTPSFLEKTGVPIYSSFDGAIDQLTIYPDRTTWSEILKEKFVRPQAPGFDVPGFEQRRLPSGPDNLAFGGWYVPLKYYKAFDDRWRGSVPDVVVGFGEDMPWKVVFWHGISYAPCFVTEKDNWMCNEFVERSKVTGWGCPENMSDKHANFSSVRIVENTPARSVVVWRHVPIGVNQKIPYQSEETMWGDCSEETYTFYPDGACVRKMEFWTSAPWGWHEWSQSLQVLHPSQRPEDVLDASRIMSVAAMDGRSQEYGWDFSGEMCQDARTLEGANIQVTYLKSEWNPFLILEDGDGVNEKGGRGPRLDRYSGRWSEYSDFPWRNHWPVAQDFVVGRYACVADAPSHTYTGTQYNAPHSVEKISGPDHLTYNPEEGVEPSYTKYVSPDDLSSTWKMTKLMLCGCTRGDAKDLLPLAKSWLRAPKMTCGGAEVPYDVTQRAYLLPSSSVDNLHVEASPESPACGLCLIVPDVSVLPESVKVNGEQYTDFKAGIRKAWNGNSLVLWMPVSSVSDVEIIINL